MGRQFGWRVGVGIAVADVLKGLLAATLVRLIAPELIWLAPAVIALGHCYPIWHGLNGGQGLAPATGALFVADPLIGLLTLLLGLLVMGAHRALQLRRFLPLGAQPVAGIVTLTVMFFVAEARDGRLAAWGVVWLAAVLLLRGVHVLLSPKPGAA